MSGRPSRAANAAERAAFADECATLAPEMRRIAEKYGRSPLTVIRVAFARARA